MTHPGNFGNVLDSANHAGTLENPWSLSFWQFPTGYISKKKNKDVLSFD